MSSRAQNTLTLPTELWMIILRLAIRTSDWKPYMFFPPVDDFTLIEGFKKASPDFCKLVETAEQILRGGSVIYARLSGRVGRREHGSDDPCYGFRNCKDCTSDRNEEVAMAKERMVVKELAEALPKLECVRWTDAWSRVYFDEEGQREYEVSRKGNGEPVIFERGIIEESWPLDSVTPAQCVRF
ncbi:uncharacterized protein FOMMEDRAFT_149801 [Fomitiporia mediterranea MF3/22]|uniref:uncharacterized protein n=1 Tax=Fomitiporia mediterranea (strain MF3/22) TaxID=694068 RepID=UPI00044086BB|nr:uncharacterized protein FOMMEDRAFT_149801 [Fomitiporia mediterranea MF3/22]EJD07289.1 hypothetical protein FOMMEDRAFT_149801 [Fomitiporia mediterranea MF3/22]